MEIAQIDFKNLRLPVVSNSVIDINNTQLTLGAIVNAVLPYVFTIAGLAVLLYLIYGGYHYIVAMGDPKGLKEAQGKIVNALIGFIIIFLAYWIVEILGIVLGIPGFSGVF